MKASDIRQKFLEFFQEKGHTLVPSSSLVTAHDPTLLFTNSGMVPFKRVFTGEETRAYKRAASSQRSLRAGGKHNDLENVGYTARHHTFFEMLGNFSFGDYFKREAIHYAWELLTQVYQLSAEKLWITVYHEDDEAYDIWAQEIGVPANRIIRIGDNKAAPYASDNFWQMADTGPCGPCSEIFYDHGPDVPGGPPGSVDEDGDRFIEIWNLVFMQFDRDSNGHLTPLPKLCVDTGMGLERIAAVLQHVHSNYEIDIFQRLIAAAAHETRVQNLDSNSLKVIADHIRACVFLILDGIIPSNEGRGYVLRRIVRRALRHGYQLGQTDCFFYRLVPNVVTEMSQAYPELVEHASRIAQVIKQEEERFQETLENGMKMLEASLARLPVGGLLDGTTLFTLYDTYGFPVDLTADICRERSITVDLAGFDQAMTRQRHQARALGKFKTAMEGLSYEGAVTEFKGYETLSVELATVSALYYEGVVVEQLTAGQEGIVVLGMTPFYAESGGQAGDIGMLKNSMLGFTVTNTLKIQSGVFGHYGILEKGVLSVGDTVLAEVDTEHRQHIMRNHSATHLLHKALRQVLGAHVQQRGSLVDATKTRFDFIQDRPLSDQQIAEVETLVNQEILDNHPTQVQMMEYDEAVKSGAMALFGEKYSNDVRVLDIGFSRELCGGTHVRRTGDIGMFKIVAESGVAAGIRRIEAITGENTLAWVQEQNSLLSKVAGLLKGTAIQAPERILQLQYQIKALEKEHVTLRAKLAGQLGHDLVTQAVKLKSDTFLLVASIDQGEGKALRDLVDQLKQKLKSAVIVLAASTPEDRIHLVAGVTSDLTARIQAGKLVQFVASQVKGKGGGRPELAMGSGTDLSSLTNAMASVQVWVEKLL